MIEKIKDVLNELHRMKPLQASENRTTIEQLGYRWSGYMLGVSGALFLLGVFFVLRVRFFAPLSEPWRLTAFLTVCLSMIAAGLALLLQALPSLYTMLQFRKLDHVRLVREVTHDHGQARGLVQFGGAALREADEWLAMIIDRRRAWLGSFVGSSDKLAVFSLAAGAWSVWKELLENNGGLHFGVYQYGVAFLIGLAFGGLLLNAVLMRYAYQRDLIALALKALDADKPAH